MKKIFCFLLIMCYLYVPKVYATSGALRKNSIKTCPNGITYGYHSSSGTIHWHQAKADSDVSSGWIAVGNPIYNDPCVNNHSNNDSNNENSNNVSTDSSNSQVNNSSNSNTSSSNSSSNSNKTESTKKEENIKSNDNTLKSIIIDGEYYYNFDNIVYITTNNYVNIEVIPNDAKANYDIKNVEQLIDGDNHISIVVTAENGAAKTYNIKIKKERILSSETGIDVTINGEKIIFENYEATINVESTITKLDIDYTLKDNKASIEMTEIEKIESGDNNLTIKVIAENGTSQEYKITIYKYSKVDDIIYTTIGLGILGGSGYGIYKLNKKKNTAS